MANLDGPIVTYDDTQGSLTFGIELEFLVPALKIGEIDPYPDDIRPVFRIADHDESEYRDSLNEFILPSLQSMEGIKMRVDTDDKFIPPHDNVPRSDDSGYPEKITNICRAIRSSRVHINHTTAVHVHVGRANAGFTLITIKKFASLLWLVDSQLLSLHHPSRHNNLQCPLLDTFSRLSMYTKENEVWWISASESSNGLAQMNIHVPDERTQVQDRFTRDLYTKFERIWASGDLEDLSYLMMRTHDPYANNPMRSSRRGTVGFRRFLPAGKTGGNINTLEFRQMAGCYRMRLRSM
ncbi:hypothetical protein BJ170DRAFT_590515 [Xylariales sp. AK1849]|nr:hypothetical protein BJ170DRAFT_590515 [Xylariales sp. AK1849]